MLYFFKQPRLSQFRLRRAVVIVPVNNVVTNNDVAPSHRYRIVGVRYQKYRSIAIPLNIGIELSQVSRYFDIFGIEPALIETRLKIF